jgi:hypothetical protein
VCPTLPLALAAAAALGSGTAATVTFAGVVAVREPLLLCSAPAPATLLLQGSGGAAAIDGGYRSVLLRVSGGGAVTVDSVSFRRGFAPFLKGTTTADYAPVTVGFPHPLAAPTLFRACVFTDGAGAYGGGAALHHGSTEFQGCSFHNCSAYGDGGPDIPHQHGGGGALYNVGGALMLRRCSFVNSTCADPPGVAPGSYAGHNGGAVLSMQGSVEAHDTDFVDGTAGQGGALYLFLRATLVARSCRFVRNRALSVANHSWGSGTGGAVFMDRGWALLDNSTFDGNTADLAGGALYAWNVHGAHDGAPLNVTLQGGALLRNEAKTQWGGALANWHSDVRVSGSRFDANDAAMMGGALWTDASSTTTLAQCTWTANNTAAQGLAVWSHPNGATELAQHNTLVVDTPQQVAHANDWFVGCTVDPGGLDIRLK